LLPLSQVVILVDVNVCRAGWSVHRSYEFLIWRRAKMLKVWTTSGSRLVDCMLCQSVWTCQTQF